MNTYFIYTLESAICLAVFYIAFLFLLRKDTFFGISRTYILSTAFVSVLLPLISIPAGAEQSSIQPIAVLNTITVEAGKAKTAVSSVISSWEIIGIIYLTGVIIFLARFVIRLIQLMNIIRKSGINKIDGYKFVFTRNSYSPFSFFNIIFLGESFLNNSESELVLTHEKVHIDKHHSYDVILFELLIILQWFNPFVWLYKRSLQELHEYQADDGVVSNGFDSNDYRNLIINQIGGSKIYQTANNFNFTLIKSRIKMLTKEKTRRIALSKLLLVIPISMLLFLSFSCKKAENSSWNPLADVVRISEDKIQSHPEFPGGWKEMWKFIDARLKVPQEMLNKKTCGKLAVRFEVNTDGSLENIRVAQSKEFGGEWKPGKLGYGCDEEAMKIVSEMPKWKPAMSDGKPVRLTQSLILFFGSQKMEAKWNQAERNKDNWMETNTNSEKNESDIRYEFPGGYDKMVEFIRNNIKYPEEARQKGIQGTVILAFNIKKDGSLTNVKVEQSVGGGCDEEAARIIKSMPNWICKSDKKQGIQEVKLPIKFKLNIDKSLSTSVEPSPYDFVSVDKEPWVDLSVLQKAIKYPEEVRHKGIEGKVILRVLVSAQGNVKNVFVENSDNNILNESAINAVKNTKFTPAVKEGKSIDCWITIPIEFKLK